MAAHEKVLVDPAFFEDKHHGTLTCAECHGGNPEAPGFEAAHKGVCRDPSDGNPQKVCGRCHQDIAARFATSLHFTLKPYQDLMEARATDSEAVRQHLAEARAASCQSCHATCGHCHVSRPAPVEGGLLAGHVFQRHPPTRLTCTACHGSRIENEYYGENMVPEPERQRLRSGESGGAGEGRQAESPGQQREEFHGQMERLHPDVHSLRRMECTACHTGAELHGTGKAYASRYDVDNGPQCKDCHQSIYAAGAPNLATHMLHKAKASCQVCHAQPYKNCASCHLGRDPKGVAFFKTGATWIDFKIGLNPAPTVRHPEKFVVVRHVPVDHETFAFYAADALTRFDSAPTWKLATPHNILRRTTQNAACKNCHGNAQLFLLPTDVSAAEQGANRGVMVAPQQVPPPR